MADEEALEAAAVVAHARHSAAYADGAEAYREAARKAGAGGVDRREAALAAEEAASAARARAWCCLPRLVKRAGARMSPESPSAVQSLRVREAILTGAHGRALAPSDADARQLGRMAAAGDDGQVAAARLALRDWAEAASLLRLADKGAARELVALATSRFEAASPELGSEWARALSDPAAGGAVAARGVPSSACKDGAESRLDA